MKISPANSTDVLTPEDEVGHCSHDECVEGSSFLPSDALFHYRRRAMNYTEPVNTSIIEVGEGGVVGWTWGV